MNENTVSIQYVRAIVGGLKRHGKKTDEMLSQFGLSSEFIANNKSRVPFDLIVALVRRSWRVLGDENMGVSKNKVPNGGFFYAGQLAIGVSSLGKSLSLLVGYYNYLDPGYSFALVRNKNEISIELKLDDPTLDEYHLLADFILGGLYRFCCWLIGKQIILKQATFDYAPPAHQADYSIIFNCPKRFNSKKLSVTFSADYLELPIVKNRTDFDSYVAVTPMSILVNPVDDDSYTTKVKRLIEQESWSNLPTFEQIAAQMHMVPKTLRQRLKKEGINYQKLKDVMRRDLAIYYLYHGNYSITDVAEKIGFTETAAFIRAFKSWTNMTPGLYRKTFIEDNQEQES
ncbi:AraC family transcriptional regulator [Thalassotalea atypica]|uniref:AraC family transcriptional regulator n=1 Tax=Thalassotalea atypica TaxID=2054316 RepID=UPI002572857E|nr:AraC family transcriptional regulator [Thalassotalea atypica]